MLKKDLTLARKWSRLLNRLEETLGKRPRDVKGVLFVIGVQELGKGFQRFEKEEKQDLIHIAICKVLSYSGYYTLEGLDPDGWPHWKLQKKPPYVDALEQEQLLKYHILEYFEKEQGWHFPLEGQFED
ncbi:MAG: hypothetical protein MI784_06825 [Cytophagales bacterium]|nr:hypothetical protein [Cytophagales bacterium]